VVETLNRPPFMSNLSLVEFDDKPPYISRLFKFTLL